MSNPLLESIDNCPMNISRSISLSLSLFLQDKVAGACLLDMMKNGLKAINKYRYSSHKEMQVLAEKYQQALDQSLV